MQTYQNPIIPGFNPDPSICRVGDTYYLVTSTFEYFPGVPIYRSKNLVNWECIGHCLTDKEQLYLDGCVASSGIYAPTIRYHEGTFFMVTTNVSHNGNFIVHTDDPSGKWSTPAWVKQGGIDPSLLFTDDKVYFVSNEDCNGNRGIYLCEVNPYTGDMLTESVLISNGTGGRFPEAPHLYKINGQFYLMLAEGGTEYGHMVTIMRSSDPYGPYEICPLNPILSHKDEENMSIVCTGHADLFEDQNNNWWMVSLGVRTLSTEKHKLMLHNLGRETFLAPVVWNTDNWPIVGDHGKLQLEMEGPLPGLITERINYFEENFGDDKWSLQLIHIRNPDLKNYIIDPQKKVLYLNGDTDTLSKPCVSPVFLGVRQTAFIQEITANLVCSPKSENQCAGLTVFYNNEHHYDIMITKLSGKLQIALRKRIYDMEAITVSEEINNGPLILKITSDKEYYCFYYALLNQPFKLLGKGSTAAMCTEITRTMTFTGTFFGMFAENINAEFSSLKQYTPLSF